MPLVPSPLQSQRESYLRDEATPLGTLDAALAKSNSNQSRNVYLAQDAAWSQNEALQLNPENLPSQPLWGIPVSLKDCFDLTGFPTSCGSTFYREHHGIATKDSAVAARLRAAGAIITGKTHLHQLAYGITGENRDFGDCLQPRNAAWLTGGSSSGAAASVQEGSALAAIGTDTGGSIRVPAALCGLAGFRASISTADQQLWQGGAHLSPSFDTLGWLYRDLRDGPALAHALFGLPLEPSPAMQGLRIGVPPRTFLHDCEPDVLRTMQAFMQLFESAGARFAVFDTAHWDGAISWDQALSIFAPIQAHEAAQLHAGNFDHFEPTIAERLRWGAAIPDSELTLRRNQLTAFREETAELFTNLDFLLLPCAPMSALLAAEDQSETRKRILRYTAPISLAGLPTVTLSGTAGGLQLAGPLGSDAQLLALSATFPEIAAALKVLNHQ